MVYNQELAARVRAAIAAHPAIEEKQMFGGITFMVAGQMCCGVLKDDLVVKVGAEGFDELLAQPHVRPFDFTGRPMVGMVYVAAGGVVSDQSLDAWVQRGVDYVTGHPRKAKRAARASR